MALATASELASYLQQDVDTASAELALDIASDWITEALPIGYTVPATVPAGIKGLCLQVSARLYTNPQGLTQESVDDYRMSRGPNALTEDELGVLARYTPDGTSPNAFTIRPAYVDPTTETWATF